MTEFLSFNTPIAMNLTLGILLVVAGGALEGFLAAGHPNAPMAMGKHLGPGLAGGLVAGALAGGLADRAPAR